MADYKAEDQEEIIDNDLSEDEMDQEEETTASPEDEPPIRGEDASYWNKKRQDEKAAKSRTSESASAPSSADLDRLVEEKLNARLGAFSEKIDKHSRDQEVRQYLANNPEFLPYEEKIVKWWADPTRVHLPLETVVLESVGLQNLAGIYTDKTKRQEMQARQSRVGGSATRRDLATQKLTVEKIENMTPQEVDAAIRNAS